MNSEAFPNIDGYRIVDTIGEGGMAQVYLAQQISFDRTVALKVLPTRLIQDESFEKRFFREAQNAAKLSHQSIVPIFDYGVSNDYHYIAMQYLPGGDLKKRMTEGLRMTNAIGIIKIIAKALDFAASKGLVHRDIKPENILFREDDTPVISDFGIARQINSQSDITLLGSLIGTPRYMSPEQAQDYEVDHRSDLYSLGVILYELLTGTAPFISDSAISVSIKHITELPPPLPPQLAAFQSIIDKALEKNPENRFQSGEELATALAQAEERLAPNEAQTIVKNNSDVSNATEAARRRKGSRYTPQGTQLNTPRPTSRTDYNTTFIAENLSKPFYKKPATIVIILLTTQALAFVGWYWSTSKPNTEVNPGQYQPDNIIPGMAEKAEELLSNAREALRSQQLFAPPNDNAQYYLTTLLALVPHHATARDEISLLFEHYLNRAEELIAAGEITEAESFLNQSSQISYYIENPDIKERFTLLYQSLLQKRQQMMIEAERSKKVEALLKRAEEALATERLTSPPGDNAFDYFQQILLEAPQHQKALDGIQKTALAMLDNARKKADEGLFPIAHAFVAAAAQIAPGQPQITETQDAIIAAERVANEQRASNEIMQPSDAFAETGKQPDSGTSDSQKNGDNFIEQQIKDWLITAQQLVELGHLITPEQDNALAFYDKVLAQDFLNIEAIQGREKIGAQLVEQANILADAGVYTEARSLLTEAARLLTNKSSLFSARQKITQLERLTTINHLLERAESAIQANQLEYPETDNAASHYKQVLALDPTNIRARQGIETVGLKYVELSRNALSKNRYSQARKLLEKAKRYTTSEIEIKMAGSFLAEAATPQTIQTLLDEAKDAVTQNRLTKPAYTNALYLYQQVLALAPDNQEALNGLTQISIQHIAMVESALNDRDFKKARELLATLKEISATDLYNNLREKTLQAEKSEASRLAERKAAQETERQLLLEQNRQKVAQYLTEISALKLEARDAKNNLGLIERFQTILDIEPDHAGATAGLSNAAEVEAELTKQALNELRINDAEKHLRNIQNIAPNHDLSTLDNMKSQAIQKRQEIEALASKIDTLLTTPYVKPGWFESHKEQRKKLTSIYNLIAEVRLNAPKDPRIGEFMARLDKKYADIVAPLIKDGDDDARDFINDTRNFDWHSPELSAVVNAAKE